METDFQRMIPSLIKKMKNIENDDLALSYTENYVLKFINRIENLSKRK